MTIRTSLYSAINEYIDQLHSKKTSKKVIKDCKFILDSFYYYVTGWVTSVEGVTTEDVALFFNYLQGCQFKYDPYRRERKPPTLEPVRFAQAKEELYSFWECAANKYGLSNPIMPKTLANDSKRIPALTPEDIQQLIKAIEWNKHTESTRSGIIGKIPLRNIAIILLLTDTGIRADEITRLSMKDVNLKESNIIIRNANNYERKMHFSNALTKILVRYLYRHYANDIESEKPLFPKENTGSPFDRKSLHSLLVNTGNKAGIKNLYALRFRAAFAKFVGEQSLFDENVMQEMGLYSKQQLRLYIDEVEYPPMSREEFKKVSPADRWDL